MRCALEHLYGKYGKYRIPRILYGLDKFKVNTSHMPFEVASKWKTSELDGLIGTMQDLPQHFFPLQNDRKKTMYHFSRDMKYKINHSTTVANAVMMYFAGYDRFSDMKKKYVVTHELGHNVATKLGDLDDSKEWLNISGWEGLKDKWTVKKKDTFVSEYAKTNPAEDFAESFTAYRFNPHLLKLVSPEKYSFMKKYVYQGIEYLNNKNCKERSVGVEKVLKDIIYEKTVQDSALSKCKKSYAKVFIELDTSRGASKELLSCLEVSMLSSALATKLSTLSNDPLYNTAIQNSVNKSDAMPLTDQQKKEYKKQILDKYIKGAAPAFQKAINSKFHGVLSTKNASEICSRDTSQYEYQKFGFLDKSMGSVVYAYNQKKKISSTVVRLCNRVLRKKIINTIVTESDVREALEDILLDGTQKK